MLGARLPVEIFHEFMLRKLDAGEDLAFSRVTSEEGLEALVRLLRRQDVYDLWVREVHALRRG